MYFSMASFRELLGLLSSTFQNIAGPQQQRAASDRQAVLRFKQEDCSEASQSESSAAAEAVSPTLQPEEKPQYNWREQWYVAHVPVYYITSLRVTLDLEQRQWTQQYHSQGIPCFIATQNASWTKLAVGRISYEHTCLAAQVPCALCKGCA